MSERDVIDPKLYDRGYTQAQIDEMEKRAKNQKSFDNLKSLDLSFSGSLENFEYPYFSYLITIHNQYKVGMLPFVGGLSDQPAQLVDAMNVLDQLKYEIDKNAHEQYKQEQKRLKNRPK